MYEIEKEFLKKVIYGAKERMGWDRLDYAPNIKIIETLLDNFNDLINDFSAE